MSEREPSAAAIFWSAFWDGFSMAGFFGKLCLPYEPSHIFRLDSNLPEFSRGKRGRVAPPQPEPQDRVRITIRLDDDLIEYFLKQADKASGTTLSDVINKILRSRMAKEKEA